MLKSNFGENCRPLLLLPLLLLLLLILPLLLLLRICILWSLTHSKEVPNLRGGVIIKLQSHPRPGRSLFPSVDSVDKSKTCQLVKVHANQNVFKQQPGRCVICTIIANSSPSPLAPTSTALHISEKIRGCTLLWINHMISYKMFPPGRSQCHCICLLGGPSDTGDKGNTCDTCNTSPNESKLVQNCTNEFIWV